MAKGNSIHGREKALSSNVTFRWKAEFWLFYFQAYQAVVSPLELALHPCSPPQISVAVEVGNPVQALMCPHDGSHASCDGHAAWAQGSI